MTDDAKGATALDILHKETVRSAKRTLADMNRALDAGNVTKAQALAFGLDQRLKRLARLRESSDD